MWQRDNIHSSDNVTSSAGMPNGTAVVREGSSRATAIVRCAYAKEPRARSLQKTFEYRIIDNSVRKVDTQYYQSDSVLKIHFVLLKIYNVSIKINRQYFMFLSKKKEIKCVTSLTTSKQKVSDGIIIDVNLNIMLLKLYFFFNH